MSHKDTELKTRNITRTTGNPVVDDIEASPETAYAIHQDVVAPDEHQIVERKREINRHSLVFRLVPEILAEILTYIAQDRIGGSHGWLKATHVCHEWREIALHSPRVWNHLHLTSDAECVKELILRSKRAPLHITADSVIPEALFDPVFSQLYRIQTLRLMIDLTLPNGSIPLPFNAPELRHLELSDGFELFTQRLQCPSGDFDVPKLEHLTLRFLSSYIPWASALFRNSITYLRLQCPQSPDSMLLGDMLAALTRMPNLKSARLYNAIPPSSQASGPIVHLPFLEALDVTDKCERCSLLLQHIICPPAATLRINLGIFVEGAVAQLGRQIASKLADPHSPDTGIRSLLLVEAPLNVLAAWKKQLRAVEITPYIPYGMDVEFSLIKGNAEPSHSIFQQILTPLSLSNVHTLHLASCTPSNPTWKSLSDSMPNVRELGIMSSDHDDDQEVLRLLVVASAPPDSPAPLPLFPRLKVLLLSGLKWYDDPYDDDPVMLRLLCRMLHSRKLSQHMVEELILKNAINLHETSLEDLRGVVGKTTWDPSDGGWEGFGDGEDEDEIGDEE